MNTAVLTGRQVSQAMKVFIVSQAGKVADVTLQSSCHAEDESVIKVGPFNPIALHSHSKKLHQPFPVKALSALDLPRDELNGLIALLAIGWPPQ